MKQAANLAFAYDSRHKLLMLVVHMDFITSAFLLHNFEAGTHTPATIKIPSIVAFMEPTTLQVPNWSWI